MKVLVLISILNIFSFAGPKIKFDKTKHDFGEREFRSKVEYTFTFTNLGDAPLIIKGHKASCHCTTALYSKEPIMPGEKGEVLVKYDATKVGKFYRKIDIYTNTANETLVIKGEIVKTDAKVNPLTGKKE